MKSLREYLVYTNLIQFLAKHRKFPILVNYQSNPHNGLPGPRKDKCIFCMKPKSVSTVKPSRMALKLPKQVKHICKHAGFLKTI